MKLTFAVFIGLTISSCAALADTFGSGPNTFTIDFVTIGNPGNLSDPTGVPNTAGAVAYIYNMGKYEISRDMISKANNLTSLAIPLADMTANGGNGVNRPATGISWNEACRFVNWLDVSSGSPPAYKFALQPGDVGYNANASNQLWAPSDAGYNASNRYRNSLARYFLPSDDEWYKAAYYDPASGNYFDFPTASNSAPTSVTSGTAANTAVYHLLSSTGPADVKLAGGLSPYGTMGQGGNVLEWEETDYDLVNDGSSQNSFRGLRGGRWTDDFDFMMSTDRDQGTTQNRSNLIGFRVASAAVPEPSTILLALIALAFVPRRHR